MDGKTRSDGSAVLSSSTRGARLCRFRWSSDSTPAHSRQTSFDSFDLSYCSDVPCDLALSFILDGSNGSVLSLRSSGSATTGVRPLLPGRRPSRAKLVRTGKLARIAKLVRTAILARTAELARTEKLVRSDYFVRTAKPSRPVVGVRTAGMDWSRRRRARRQRPPMRTVRTGFSLQTTSSKLVCTSKLSVSYRRYGPLQVLYGRNLRFISTV